MKKFTILTFALLLSACAVGPPYPNERERRADTYYGNDRDYRYSHDNYDRRHWNDRNHEWDDDDDDYDHDDHNWDGTNRYYNRNN